MSDNTKIIVQAAIDIQKNTQQLNAQIKQIKAEALKIDATVAVDTKSAKQAIQNVQKDINAQLKAIGSSGNFTAYLKNIKPQALKEYSTEINNIATGFKNVKTQADLTNVNAQVTALKGTIKAAGLESKSFFTVLKDDFAKFTEWIGVGTIIMSLINGVKDAIQYVNKLNVAMTNIEMITGNSKETISQYTQEYVKLASALHDTTSNLMEASEEFLRAGNSQEATLKLLEASTVMSKISGQTQEDTAQSLIAIMNAFNMSADQMMGVVDKMVAIDNTSATSTAELSAAIKDTAQSAQLAGSSFANIISYIGTVSSVSRRSADVIGQSFKTIYQRYSAIREGTGIDELGEDISNVEKDLQSMGIALRSDIGTFRNFDIVIGELAAKWTTLSDVQKSQITQDLAGEMCA